MTGENTDKLLAVRYPNSHHLFDDLEKVCGIVKTQNNGRARVGFDALGIDAQGNLIVKCIEAGLKFFRLKSDNSIVK